MKTWTAPKEEKRYSFDKTPLVGITILHRCVSLYYKEEVMKSWIVSTEIVCILMQAVFAGPIQAAKNSAIRASLQTCERRIPGRELPVNPHRAFCLTL
ncbi:MAG: hypothetical protein MUO68_25320 [Desulfobacteraceae bacterium]|nr:hypothetical protein [Desulfobacteraceae bacterium]